MLSKISFDIAIIFIFSIVLFFEILSRKKINQKIEGLEKKIVTIQKIWLERSKNMDERLTSLKERLFENENQLKININELSKQMNVMLEKYNTIRQELEKELDRKVEALQASFDDTLTSVNSSQEAMKGLIKEGEEEIKKMAEGISAFAEEIRKMKDFIRERTIDIEL